MASLVWRVERVGWGGGGGGCNDVLFATIINMQAIIIIFIVLRHTKPWQDQYFRIINMCIIITVIIILFPLCSVSILQSSC